MPRRVEYLVAILVVALGCSAPGNSVKVSGDTQARWDPGEDWHDLVLPVEAVAQAPDGSSSIRAIGTLEGKRVGLEVVVRAGMKPGMRGSEPDLSAFYQGGILLRTLGDPTEALVERVAHAYRVARPPGRLQETVALTSFALAGDPSRIDAGEIRFKVFHDENNVRGQYYELYVNVDVPHGTVTLAEKDPEYRPNVVRGFVKEVAIEQ